MRKRFAICIVSLCLSLLCGCGDNKEETIEEVSSVEETQSEKNSLTEFMGLTFEIPNSWNKWGASFSDGKQYVFSDIDNYESVFYASLTTEDKLTGTALIDEACSSLENRYDNLVVRKGDIEGKSTALCSFSDKTISNTTRKNTVFYVEVGIGRYAVFNYEVDESVTPEHKEEFEMLLDSIKVTE